MTKCDLYYTVHELQQKRNQQLILAGSNNNFTNKHMVTTFIYSKQKRRPCISASVCPSTKCLSAGALLHVDDDNVPKKDSANERAEKRS